jgi:DNA adenine methylase
MSEAKITALAPWAGGKRTLGPVIVEEIGDHNIYWEPFCGSMAVLLAKPKCRTEVVNDLHDDLVNLARVIQDPRLGPALYRRLRRTLFGEPFFRDSLDVVRNSEVDWMCAPDVDRAYHYFVVSWMGMNGMAGVSKLSTNFARRFSSLGGDPAVRFRGAVGSIASWRRRLDRVQVLQSDGIELCEKIEDRVGTVIYADPPYLVKGFKYRHDFSEAHHERLATALGRFRRTRVVVSYYEHPLIASLYPGWRVRPLEATKGVVNQSKRDQTGATKAPEVLLINDGRMF